MPKINCNSKVFITVTVTVTVTEIFLLTVTITVTEKISNLNHTDDRFAGSCLVCPVDDVGFQQSKQESSDHRGRETDDQQVP